MGNNIFFIGYTFRGIVLQGTLLKTTILTYVVYSFKLYMHQAFQRLTYFTEKSFLTNLLMLIDSRK